MDDETDLALIQRWQQHGDERARAKLLHRHDAFLRSMAWRAARRWGMDVDDAYQQSAMGFCRALDKFEPEHGVKLITYAKWWVRHYLYHERRQQQVVRRPSYIYAIEQRVRKAELELRALGIEPTPAALADKVGAPIEFVQHAMELTAGDTSLHAPVTDDNTTAQIDLLADEGPSPEEQVDTNARVAQVETALESLPPSQADALRMYYLDEMSLEEIGKLRGVTRQAVSLQVHRAEAAVRGRMSEANLQVITR